MFRVLKKIESLLKESFKGRVRTFFIGDPSLIPESSLPCIAISPVSTNINIADTGRDFLVYTVEVIVVINVKNEIEGKVGQLVGTEFLTEIMEEINENGQLKENTILHIIRENLRIEKNLEISNINDITYEFGEIPEQLLVKEARLRLDVTRIITRP